jgi:hypothetical protein
MEVKFDIHSVVITRQGYSDKVIITREYFSSNSSANKRFQELSNDIKYNAARPGEIIQIYGETVDVY